MAFLFCTCIEVGQTLVSMLAGGARLLDFVQSFCWGGVGLCGLVCMLYASGHCKELPLFRIPADNKPSDKNSAAEGQHSSLSRNPVYLYE